MWIISGHCSSTINKKQQHNQEEDQYSLTSRKARNRPTTITFNYIFLIFIFGCCKSKDLPTFYGWRYFFHWKKSAKNKIYQQNSINDRRYHAYSKIIFYWPFSEPMSHKTQGEIRVQQHDTQESIRCNRVCI